ncbi:hypothetical protein [Coleofasciculus sp.]|uniref:hypothetical protein n=1 Tax=Coleofasciculus sp. TaxID=3100458 RepID=UPI0039FA8D81
MPDFSPQLVIANGVPLITALPLSLWGIWGEKSSLCWFFSLKSAFFGVPQGTGYLFLHNRGDLIRIESDTAS